MTDQNQNTPEWNDPNRHQGAPDTRNVEGGNQSGGQQPSGQPGVYSENAAAAPEGQYGQPGEYAAPSAHQTEGHYGQPGEYVRPDSASAPSGYTDQFGQPGQYGQQPAFGQQGPSAPQGAYGQQNSTGQYAPYGQQAPSAGYPGQQDPSAFGAPTPQPQQKERKPRTDENGEPYGVGPFTLRETIVAGLGVLLLIASFLPLLGGEYAAYVGYSNLWGPVPWLVIPGALVFIAASALLVLRRTVSSVRWRVGSLSVDQFASAAAISTAGFHLGAILLMLGLGVWFGGSTDGFAPGAGPILGLVVSMAAIALTTFANRIPPFSADFRGRPEAEAHPFARAAKDVPQRPKPEPQAQQAWDGGQNQTTGSWPTSSPTGPVGGHDPQASAAWPQAPSEPWPGTPAAAEHTSATAEPSATGSYASVQDASAPGRGQTPADPRTALDADAPRVQPSSTHGSSSDAGPVDHTDTTAYDAIDESTIHRAPTAEHDQHVPEPAAEEPVVQFAAEESATVQAPAEQTPAEQTPAEQPSAEPAPVFAPYWVLAPENRTVVDLSTGSPLFDVGPTAWALAVGEHEGGLVIRADDGRVGVLRSVEGLTRG